MKEKKLYVKNYENGVKIEKMKIKQKKCERKNKYNGRKKTGFKQKEM